MKIPKKICILLPSLKFGGGERVNLNLALEMKRLGVAVDILVMSNEGEFLEEAQDNFNVYNLECNKTYKLPYLLIRYLLINRPYALISNFWKLNLCACISRLFFPFFKLILWEHSPPSRAPFAPVWFYSVTASILYQLSTRIVTVSNGVRYDIQRHTLLLNRKMVTIYNPISPPPINIIKKKILKDKNIPQIISVGRLAIEKNLHLLIHSFKILTEKNNAKLLIVGEGNIRNELEQLCIELDIFEKVEFYGYTKNPYELIVNADILVLTSNFEGLPSSIIEGLYCGLPIVSTDCKYGPRELLCDGKYGSLVPLNDAQSFANAMELELTKKRNPETQKLAAVRFLPNNVAKQFLLTMY